MVARQTDVAARVWLLRKNLRTPLTIHNCIRGRFWAMDESVPIEFDDMGRQSPLHFAILGSG